MNDNDSQWIGCLKVVELKMELLSRGQLTSGLKDILLARLTEVETSFK